MNEDRRKRIRAIVAALEEAKDLLEDLEIEPIHAEEQDAYDNMPEGLQQGERGQQIEAAASLLETAGNDLDTVRDSLDEVIESLNEAME